MVKETTKEKGQRLADEGRVEKVGKDEYLVHGDSGKPPYRVKKGGTFFFCPCPSRKRDCSHVEAVHVVRMAAMRVEMARLAELEEMEPDPEIEAFEARFADFSEDEATEPPSALLGAPETPRNRGSLRAPRRRDAMTTITVTTEKLQQMRSAKERGLRLHRDGAVEPNGYVARVRDGEHMHRANGEGCKCSTAAERRGHACSHMWGWYFEQQSAQAAKETAA